MPVKLWSGLPGAGKTACMIAEILEFRKRHPERPVFAININGLDASVAEPLTLEQLHEWWELPPQSVICIDECQEDDFFPLDRGQPPAWVKRISKVRHEGMDFWVTTQHPALMSGYVRRLIDQHVHSVRKFNSQVVSRFRWSRCMDQCEKGSAQKVAIHQVGTLPKQVFELYKSSNAHNMEMRVPLRAWLLPVFAVIALGAAIAVPFALHKMRAESAKAVHVAPVSDAPGHVDRASDVSVSDRLRDTDYAKWMRPRVDGLPWSAPMFDHLTVKAEPRLYCIAVDDGRCSCMTEQGTRYAVPLDRCRSMVRDGIYNPFAEPDRQQERGEAQRTPVQPQAPPAAASRRDPVGIPGPVAVRATSSAYDPPGYGNWNADPFGSSQN